MGTSFEQKHLERFSLVLKTVENIAKEAIKARVIDLKITHVSNYSYPITKSSNRTSVTGHPHDCANYVTNRHVENQSQQQFCYRYNYY